MKSCLEELVGWLKANKLKLNPDKKEVLLFVSGKCLHTGMQDDVAPTPKACVCSIRALLNLEQLLDVQVAVARNTLNQFRLVCQLPSFLDMRELAITVAHAMISPGLTIVMHCSWGCP